MLLIVRTVLQAKRAHLGLNWSCRHTERLVKRLTMLLWCALVISSILPTKSVVDTPWVLLHSLQLHIASCLLVSITFCLPVLWQLTCSALTSSLPRMYLSHPQLKLCHLQRAELPSSLTYPVWFRIGVHLWACVDSTSMHAEITVVFVKCLKSGDIRSPFHNFIHPFYGSYHFVSLLLGEDRWTLVLWNLTLKTTTTTSELLIIGGKKHKKLIQSHLHPKCCQTLRITCFAKQIIWFIIFFCSLHIYSLILWRLFVFSILKVLIKSIIDNLLWEIPLWFQQ